MLVYPRGNRKILADYKFKEIYNFYKERYKEDALPRHIVKEIYKRLFPEIVKLMVFENLDYRLPARLGSLRIKKKEVGPRINQDGKLDTRGLSVNWKKTKQLWQKIYPDKTANEISSIEGKPVVREMNEHSNGYRLIWFWDKSTCNVKNQSAYIINITRDNDKILSSAVKTNNLNYYT
jgi:hypothetical protein